MSVEQQSGFEEKELTHNCAVVGVFAPDKDVVGISTYALQHMNSRGQEGSGLAVYGSGRFEVHKAAGWVKNIYTQLVLDELRSNQPFIAVGQDRYSTSGDSDAWQPFIDEFALAHNGNLTNSQCLYERLPQTSQREAVSDSWIMFEMIRQSNGATFEDKLRKTVAQCEGAYNLIISHDSKLYAIRDPWGFRPLSIAQLPSNNGEPNGYIVASETSAFTPLNARFIRDVLPGEGIVIDENGVNTFFVDERTDINQLAQCIFELVYISAPDSVVFGKYVSQIRRECGRIAARKDIAKGFLPDVIIPVQHSGITFAEGYAQEYVKAVCTNPQQFGLSGEQVPDVAAGLVPQTGLVVNQYAGRSFIAPNNRSLANNSKHRSDESVVAGKTAVIVDDSIVRGDALEVANRVLKNARVLKETGASQVHARIGCPPIQYPCYMGVDTPNPEELLANRVAPPIEEGIAKFTGVDSVSYLTPRELLRAVVGEDVELPDIAAYKHHGYCGACFLGEYPIPIAGSFGKKTYARK